MNTATGLPHPFYVIFNILYFLFKRVVNRIIDTPACSNPVPARFITLPFTVKLLSPPSSSAAASSQKSETTLDCHRCTMLP